MADIRPFRGLRPKPELVTRVASPPYDVLSSDEARLMARDNPSSYLRVVKAEIDLDPSVDSHSDEVYEKSRANLDQMVADGTLIRDEAPCFYLYKLTMGEHVQTGIMVGASVDEYEKGLIKKHEFTRRDKEDDRAHHVDVLDANTGPVMLTYAAEQAIDAIVTRIQTTEAPVYDFVAADGIGHAMWVVSDEADVQAIRGAFEAVPAMYVADGHHRSAAGFRVRNLRRDRNPQHTGEESYNHYLAVVFPDDQLQILGYYRALEGLNGLDEDGFMAKVREVFDVSPLEGDPLPPAPRHFSMYLGGSWYRLVAKEGTYPADDPVKSLDVAILQDNLLAPVLGIEDPRTATGIDFIGGIRGTAELERRCKEDMVVAFALYPTTVAELMAIADAGEVMPPKSTWFEPKLRSGMVTRLLD